MTRPPTRAAYWFVTAVVICPQSQSNVSSSVVGASGFVSRPMRRMVRLQPGHGGGADRARCCSGCVAIGGLQARNPCSSNRNQLGDYSKPLLDRNDFGKLLV